MTGAKQQTIVVESHVTTVAQPCSVCSACEMLHLSELQSIGLTCQPHPDIETVPLLCASSNPLRKLCRGRMLGPGWIIYPAQE